MKRLGKRPIVYVEDNHADHIHLDRAEANYLRILLEATIDQAKVKVKEAMISDDVDDTKPFMQISLATASVDKAQTILGRITDPCDCL